MYGQAGIILGGKGAAPASAIISPGCSPGSSHSASGRGRTPRGVAWLKRHGRHKLFKQPVRAGRFVLRQGVPRGPGRNRQPHHAALGSHPPAHPRGDEKINENNHPIRAGDILGTHNNGTIYNANTLFRRFKPHRFAEVDSELLFRLAARAGRNGRIDVERFKGRLKLYCGQMAAVMASRLDPETILVLKGNKPHELAYPPSVPGCPLCLRSGVSGRDPGRRTGLARAARPHHEPDGVPAPGSDGLLDGSRSSSLRKRGDGRSLPWWRLSMTGRARSTRPSEPPKENTLELLTLFVCGTLKSGYWNHDPFCGFCAGDPGDAGSRGRLYEGPGFPVLEGPGRGCPRPGDRRPVGRHRHTGLLGGQTGAPVRSGGVTLPTSPRKRHSGRLGRRVREAAHLRRP